MKYEELQERISKLTAENFQAELVDILKDIKQDYTTRDSLAAKNAENEDKIRTLQDTNARLFLGQTSTPDNNENEDEEEETPFNLGDVLAEREKENNNNE